MLLPTPKHSDKCCYTTVMKAITPLLCLVSITALAIAAEDDWTPLFNGKDLTGWEGNKDLWSVEDGCITGRTPANPEKPAESVLTHNTFLVWKAGTVKDFELTFEYRLEKGNSGVQYRTHELEARRDDVAWLTERVAACRAGNTVHITAADGEGSVVGCTSTLGESAGLVVPGTGVALNNFLGEPDIAPRDRRAAIGHRMMTSMCPVLFQRDGATLGVGSAGSSRIRSAVPQVVVNRVDRGMDLATAIAAPRVHVEDGMLYVEGHGRLRAEVEALLGWPGGASRANWPLGFYFGGAQAVSFDGHGFDGGADVARRGCAVAFA